MVINTLPNEGLSSPVGEAADRIRTVLGAFNPTEALAALAQVTGEWHTLTAGEHHINPDVAKVKSLEAQEKHMLDAEKQAVHREHFVACYAASPVAVSAAKLAVRAVEARATADKRATIVGQIQGMGLLTSLVETWANRADSNADKLLEKAHIAKRRSDTTQNPIARGVVNIDMELDVLETRSNRLNARADRIKRGIDRGAAPIPVDIMLRAMAAAEEVEAGLSTTDAEVARLDRFPQQVEPHVLRRVELNLFGAKISVGSKRLRLDKETVAELDRKLDAERRYDELYQSENPKDRKKATNLPEYAAYLGSEKLPARKRLPDLVITRDYRSYGKRQPLLDPAASLRPMIV